MAEAEDGTLAVVGAGEQEMEPETEEQALALNADGLRYWLREVLLDNLKLQKEIKMSKAARLAAADLCRKGTPVAQEAAAPARGAQQSKPKTSKKRKKEFLTFNPSKKPTEQRDVDASWAAAAKPTATDASNQGTALGNGVLKPSVVQQGPPGFEAVATSQQAFRRQQPLQQPQHGHEGQRLRPPLGFRQPPHNSSDRWQMQPPGLEPSEAGPPAEGSTQHQLGNHSRSGDAAPRSQGEQLQNPAFNRAEIPAADPRPEFIQDLPAGQNSGLSDYIAL